MSALPRLTLVGNACVLIEVGRHRVLTDPWLTSHVGPWQRMRPASLSPSDLRRDSPHSPTLVLISHGHPDHLCVNTLRHLSPLVPVITPGGGPTRRLARMGLNVHTLEEWEEWESGEEHGLGLTVCAAPSVHARDCLSYLIRAADRSIYFAGDAGPRTPFEAIRRRLGVPDAALLPVGGSRLAPRALQRHLTPELALQAARDLRARLVIPMHWGHMACVPSVLDRFRGTGRCLHAAANGRHPEMRIALPEDGETVHLD